MAVSRVIEVSFGRSSVALVRIDTAYFYNNGIIFKPTDIDLPASYQVHWADSPQASSTLETIGTAEGAPIPDDLWNRSRVIYGWIYLHPTEDSGITYKEVRIYKNVRAGLPDGTEPTPAEQSTIDQLIGALNSAVEQTGEDVESAEQAKDDAESARDNAQTYANNAQSSAQASARSAESASQSARTASEKATASAQSASQSAQIKSDVEDLVDDAQGYADSASQSASQASASEQGCARAVLDAASAAAIARARADEASGYAQTASTKASEAVGCVETATQKATESAQSASQALIYKNDAESAKTASQTAQGLAESARDTAVSAKTDAESARDDAVQAKEDAESAVASISGALTEKAPVITDTASGAIASFSDGADDLPLKSLVVDINPVQDLSHGDPSPENICPISGWDEVNVTRTGKNLLDPDISAWSLKGRAYRYINGVVPEGQTARITLIDKDTSIDTSEISFGFIANDLSSEAATTYTWVKTGDTINSNATNVARNGNVGTLCRNVFIYPQSEATFNALFARYYVMVEIGSTASSYEPYQGTTIPINWETEAGTVYGGKLDVLSGELTVDRASVDLGTLDWRYDATSYSGWDFFFTNLPTKNSGAWNCGICSSYRLTSAVFARSEDKVFNMTTYRGYNTVNIRDTSYTDATAFKTAMSGVQLCYELAEPITIQLTPNQVNSLLGVNNIWADSGDTEVEYRADTKLFIERLTAPDSADMIADANITSGQYFMVGNSLYKATANIANGGQIIVGTNATRVSLAQALNEINA